MKQVAEPCLSCMLALSEVRLGLLRRKRELNPCQDGNMQIQQYARLDSNLLTCSQ